LLFLFNVLKILTDGKILINYSKTILIIFQDPSGAWISSLSFIF
jgi:hypothetical protein